MKSDLANLALDQTVDVYAVKDAEITSDELIETYRLLLSDEERARGDRFHFGHDRHQFLVGRALIRTTLSHYAPAIEPRAWRFVTNPFGRPAIEGADRLHFNLTHTHGTIVLAVAAVPLIGVDVENYDRTGSIDEIAAKYFCRSEYNAFIALPVEAQQEAFFDLWTLKEAYVKACGSGMAIPFADVCFDFQDGTGVSVSFASNLADDPRRWRFWCMRPHAGTTLSVAVADHRYDVTLRLYEGVPLAGFEAVPIKLRHATTSRPT